MEQLIQPPNPLWLPTAKPWSALSASQQQSRRVLWSAGRLKYKLDPLQVQMHTAAKGAFAQAPNSAERWFYFDCSRQVGKDWTSSVLVLETVYQVRRPIRIVYAGATQVSVRELLVPNLVKLFDDCPPELLPREIQDGTFLKSADRLTWPWGAQVVMVGMDLHPGRLRGPATHAAVFSEAAFYSAFGDTLRSIVIPQLQTEPDGWWIIATTPPESAGHEIDTEWLPLAKRTGRHFHASIQDNPRLTPEAVEAQIRMVGGDAGRKSTMVRRELFAEHVTEQSRQVIPEWQDVKGTSVREFTRPQWVDCYVSLDPGIVHLCASQQGFYDFTTDTLYIEGDFAEAGLNTWDVALRLWAREWQLWGTVPQKPKKLGEPEWQEALGEIRSYFYPDLPTPTVPLQRWNGQNTKAQPYIRVSDTDKRLITDLYTQHGLLFQPAQKDNREAAINNLRLRIQQGKIVIHPRCIHTLAHLDGAIWNSKRTGFAESKTQGHWDALASLLYLDRTVQRGRNPYPPNHHHLSGVQAHTHHIPLVTAPKSRAGQSLEAALLGRSDRGHTQKRVLGGAIRNRRGR